MAPKKKPAEPTPEELEAAENARLAQEAQEKLEKIAALGIALRDAVREGNEVFQTSIFFLRMIPKHLLRMLSQSLFHKEQS